MLGVFVPITVAEYCYKRFEIFNIFFQKFVEINFKIYNFFLIDKVFHTMVHSY